MRTGIDSRIDAFCQLLERADRLHGQLRSLEASILDRDDLSKRIEQSTSQHERNQLTQSLADGEHPLALRNRRVKLEIELRHVLPETIKAKREALDAASELITDAAGGTSGLTTFPFARWHVLELTRHRPGPSAQTTQAAHLAHMREALQAIDFAVAAIREIEFEAGNCCK